MSKNVWNQSGNLFFPSEVTNQVEKLKAGLYCVTEDKMTGKLFLTNIGETFEIPSKLYGMDHLFADRVVKAHGAINKNLGVILNGLKGTGKTIIAKIICNKLKMPVIIINEDFEGIKEFLNAIQQDVIIFIDEYEKVYKSYNDDLLTLMDGVLDGNGRKLFLLTTNELYVSSSMLSRPSRIRYIKKFEDLDLNTIKEIVSDLLKDKKFARETINYISKLDIITVDIVKSIVEEINIFNEPVSKFKDVFNTKEMENQFDVYEIDSEGEEERVYNNVSLEPIKINNEAIGKEFDVNDTYLGTIKTVIKNIITVDVGKETKTYRIENVEYKHKAFSFLA